MPSLQNMITGLFFLMLNENKIQNESKVFVYIILILVTMRVIYTEHTSCQSKVKWTVTAIAPF
jgi:hypothetical protein